MVVHHADTFTGEGMQYGFVEHEQGTVLPQVSVTLQSEPLCHFWQEVVAISVAEVASTDLGSHVPTVEGGAGKDIV